MRRAYKVSWIVISVVLWDCGGRAAPLPQGTTTNGWRRKATSLLEAGNCRETIAYLNTVGEREPLWYELVSQAHMSCWRRNKSATDAKTAISAIDQGLKAFPQSANLLLSRGYGYQELGHRDE